MVRLQFEGAGVESCEERFCEGEFGHFGDTWRGFGEWVQNLGVRSTGDIRTPR